jgi:putative ABC transport system substrate-binding protein
MRRREFITLIGGAAAAWPLAARAQQRERVRRIVFLHGIAENDPEAQARVVAFRQGLEALGWVENRNIQVEHRFSGGDFAQMQTHTAEVVDSSPDLIVASSSPVIAALKQATNTIPIVFAVVNDPLGQGFVANQARPGGNITGVLQSAEPTMASKRLELIKEAVPRAVRIAILTTGEGPSRSQVQWAEKAAPSLGVKLVVVEVRDADYDRAFATFVTERADALCVVASVILTTDRQRIIQLATKHRLPAIYDWREWVEAGGLIAYGGSTLTFTRRAAVYVDRIFKGANPADLPVERATTFELAINLKTAKALGLTLPSSLRLRADHVIE